MSSVIKNEELKTLQEKIKVFLDLARELRDVGVYNLSYDHFDNKIYLEAHESTLLDLTQKYNLKTITKKRETEAYPYEISVPDLKMRAITTEDFIKDNCLEVEEEVKDE